MKNDQYSEVGVLTSAQLCEIVNCTPRFLRSMVVEPLC